MSNAKNVVFLLESSPTTHLRFFEGLRMTLGFSVSHRPVTVILLGEGVRILLPMNPPLLGLPSEITEVLPLLQDLRVRILAEESSLERFFLDRPVPSYVESIGKSGIRQVLSEADLVLPFLRRYE